MIDIHSKYDNMRKNVMFYSLICINNHIMTCIYYMLLTNRPLLLLYSHSPIVDIITP